MSNKTILALGADIKNRFLLAKNERLLFGPDIGDLSIAENYELFKRNILSVIKKHKPHIIAYDLHPGYFSSNFLKGLTLHLTLNTLHPVQHHHAHIASVMQEHNLKGQVLGVCFDGTGFGTDANIWGGEFLIVDKKSFKRAAYLKYRMMPGGEKVVSQPWRMALSILGKKALPFLKEIDNKDKKTALLMIAKGINCPLSSSAGRTFDAAAALLGICQRANYEAEGPIKLEALCDKNTKSFYNFKTVKANSCFIIDTDGLFLGMVNDLIKKIDVPVIATRFHNSMVEIIVKTAKLLSSSTRIKTIALSGGVFGNQFLKSRAIDRLNASGFKVFTNNKTQANDLNISLGQYYIACLKRR
ncbi:MAG: hypothetical protein V2A72_01585 [Candidatus Omnitrophota bacterium]